MNLDVELPRLAKAILKSERSPESVMRSRMPRFLAHLKRVQSSSAVLRRWGKCVNVDELSGTEIVDPKILGMLGRQTKADMRPPSVHAGIQHTYGYLLSLTKTPFGYKRTRWLNETIERGFGLPNRSLQAFPHRGVLINNLTDFLSLISLPERRPPRHDGPRPICDAWSPSGLNGWRITEIGSTAKRRVKIQIDLVPFPHQVRSKNCAILIYSVGVNDSPSRLITTFPIGAEMQANMLALPCGARIQTRLRFNAFVDGFAHGPFSAQRSIAEWTIA